MAAHPLLRPRWIVGHLLALVAVVGFIQLGMWQLRRNDEKATLRRAVAAAQALPPVPIEGAPAGSYRVVTAAGEYDADHEALVLRAQDGRSGYLVLTPLTLPGDSAVVVVRGWVPIESESIPLPPPGIVQVVGTLWPAEKGSSLPPSLDPERGLPRVVRRVDPGIQQAFVDYTVREEPLVLSVQSPPLDGVVAPAQPEISRGPHLGYAIQWFTFTAIVLIGYPLLLIRRRRD